VDAEPVKLAETALAAEASFAGAGVQRAASPLCLGAGAAAHCWGQGATPIGGQPPHRVKGEAPCPGKVDACVNLYWVLPDADFRRICGFAALPRPRNIFAGRRKIV